MALRWKDGKVAQLPNIVSGKRNSSLEIPKLTWYLSFLLNIAESTLTGDALSRDG